MRLVCTYFSWLAHTKELGVSVLRHCSSSTLRTDDQSSNEHLIKAQTLSLQGLLQLRQSNKQAQPLKGELEPRLLMGLGVNKALGACRWVEI